MFTIHYFIILPSISRMSLPPHTLARSPRCHYSSQKIMKYGVRIFNRYLHTMFRRPEVRGDMT